MTVEPITSPPARPHVKNINVTAFVAWLLGTTWIIATGIAAERTAAITAPSLPSPFALSWIVLLAGLALMASRARHAPPYCTLSPVCLVAIVWAGLIATRHADAIDALGLVLALAAWLAVTSRRSPTVAVALAGAAVAVCPLQVGLLSALVWAMLGKSTRPLSAWATAGALVIGAMVGLAGGVGINALLGGPSAAPLERLGFVGAWQHLAELVDLLGPLLALGMLGAVVVSRGQDATRGGNDDDDPASTAGLAIWLGASLAIAAIAPVHAAAHTIALTAPAVLLAPTGWHTLRQLVARDAPAVAVLPGALSLILLGVLSWSPVAAAARTIWMGFVPP